MGDVEPVAALKLDDLLHHQALVLEGLLDLVSRGGTRHGGAEERERGTEGGSVGTCQTPVVHTVDTIGAGGSICSGCCRHLMERRGWSYRQPACSPHRHRGLHAQQPIAAPPRQVTLRPRGAARGRPPTHGGWFFKREEGRGGGKSRAVCSQIRSLSFPGLSLTSRPPLAVFSL